MKLNTCDTSRSSTANGGAALSIKVDTTGPAIEGARIAASSGSALVTLQVPNTSTARSIVARWEALASLNQEISRNPSGENVRTFRDLACAFGAQVLRDVDGLPGPLVPRISQLHIQSPDECSVEQKGAEPFAWTHIERPHRGAIEWAAARAGVEPGDLERYLEDSDPCCVLKSSTSLITRTYELALPDGDDELGKVEAKGCTMICGDEFLITLLHEPASAVQQVWSDIEHKRVYAQEYCSSSAIARLLVEAAVGEYQHTVEELGRRIGNFWQGHASRTPRDIDMRVPQAMRKDLRACERFMLGFDDTLAKLEQRETLEGRSTNPSLHKNVVRTLAELERSLSRCDQDIRDGESSWSSLRDQWRNQILFKLAVLSGLCVPVGVWAGIGGMNFIHPLPDWVLWSGLAASTLVSAGLVGALIAGKSAFFKFLSGPPNDQ